MHIRSYFVKSITSTVQVGERNVCLSRLSGRKILWKLSDDCTVQEDKLQSTQWLWSVRLWLMLQNCGAGRNACAERRSLAALQRHSEGNVSGVLITFAIHSLRRPTIHTQFSGFLKNEIFTLRIQTYTRTLQFIERTIDLCEYDRQDFVVAKSLLWFGASLVRDARKY